MIRLGLICSGGGSVAGAAVKLLRSQGYMIEVAMVTDRACAAERVASDMGFSHRRIDFSSKDQFSREAATWLFDEQNMDWCCLLFLRLVSAPLFSRAPCVNLHPSFLPAFRGFGALEAARLQGVRFFGATAHLVNETIDGGPILAQVISPLKPEMELAIMQRISFAQKLYLLLVVAESMERQGKQGALFGSDDFNRHKGFMSPGLRDQGVEAAFYNYVAEEGIPWVT